MTIENSDLDQMQAAYNAAVDQWITAIREEESLASIDHSEADVDAWEAAGFREEDARAKAKQTKKDYEAALRAKFSSRSDVLSMPLPPRHPRIRTRVCAAPSPVVEVSCDGINGKEDLPHLYLFVRTREETAHSSLAATRQEQEQTWL